MLEKEFKYYLDNQKELVQMYPNKFIVIIGSQVVGEYGSQSEAYKAATDKYELGTFLIQHCQSGTQSHTQTFHSRAIILR